MDALLTAPGRAADDAVTLSVTLDGYREAAMRDQQALYGARDMLAEAYEAGAETPRSEKLVQQATALLAKGSPTLSQEELGTLLGVDATTVSKWRTRSKPGGSMAAHPFPTADNDPARFAIWMVTRVPELFAWQAARPGRGAGGGRPWHSEEQPKPELLTGLPRDWWTTENVLTYLEAIGQKVTRGRLLRMVGAGEAPEEERMFGAEKAWKPATIRAWRPAAKAAAKK